MGGGKVRLSGGRGNSKKIIFKVPRMAHSMVENTPIHPGTPGEAWFPSLGPYREKSNKNQGNLPKSTPKLLSALGWVYSCMVFARVDRLCAAGDRDVVEDSLAPRNASTCLEHALHLLRYSGKNLPYAAAAGHDGPLLPWDKFRWLTPHAADHPFLIKLGPKIG